MSHAAVLFVAAPDEPLAGGPGPAAAELIVQLRADGLAAELAASPAHARTLAARRAPAVVILADGGRGAGSALELLAEIRREQAQGSGPWEDAAGVIVVGRRRSEVDMLRAFEHGADDFIAAPVSYLELRARVRALARRAGTGSAERRLRAGALEVDVRQRRALIAGRPLTLSRLEFELLAHLALEPQRVFTKQELLRDVWGFRAPGATRTLDSHACRLRRKLAACGDGRWVANVWGVGYRLRG